AEDALAFSEITGCTNIFELLDAETVALSATSSLASIVAVDEVLADKFIAFPFSLMSELLSAIRLMLSDWIYLTSISAVDELSAKKDFVKTLSISISELLDADKLILSDSIWMISISAVDELWISQAVV